MTVMMKVLKSVVNISLPGNKQAGAKIWQLSDPESLQLFPFFRGKAKHDLMHFHETSGKIRLILGEILFFSGETGN